MPRRTRSIVLVLIGAGFAAPGCDDRRGHPSYTSSSDSPAEPDGSPAGRPTTGPVYGSNGAVSSPGYAPAYRYTHSGTSWVGGSMFGGRSGYGHSYAGSSGSASPSFSHGGGTASAEGEGHGATFGGFGGHASAGHGGGE